MDVSISVIVNDGFLRCAVIEGIKEITEPVFTPQFEELFTDAYGEECDAVTLTCHVYGEKNTAVISFSGMCTERRVSKYTMLAVKDILETYTESATLDDVRFCDFTVYKGFIDIK